MTFTIDEGSRSEAEAEWSMPDKLSARFTLEPREWVNLAGLAIALHC